MKIEKKTYGCYKCTRLHLKTQKNFQGLHLVSHPQGSNRPALSPTRPPSSRQNSALPELQSPPATSFQFENPDYVNLNYNNTLAVYLFLFQSRIQLDVSIFTQSTRHGTSETLHRETSVNHSHAGSIDSTRQ